MFLRVSENKMLKLFDIMLLEGSQILDNNIVKFWILCNYLLLKIVCLKMYDNNFGLWKISHK